MVTGRPGSGKTTLAEKLSKELYLPKLSRDEIKEGYVNTFNIKHDNLSKDTNITVNEIFFESTINFLNWNVSIIIEAAFQHKLWNTIISKIIQIAQPFIIICDLDEKISAKRHLERGLKDPNREFFHGDKRVSIYRETGQFLSGGTYDTPDFDLPTLLVSTHNGYLPEINEIIKFIKEKI